MYKCPYCSSLIKALDHISICEYHQTGLCYSCGTDTDGFTNNQLAKNNSRCKTCVLNEVKTRYMPYNRLFVADNNDEASRFIEYINSADLNAVKTMLNDGIDPDIMRIKTEFVQVRIQTISGLVRSNRYVIVYDTDGEPIRESMTGAESIVFSLSDCNLTEIDRKNMFHIMELLVASGANTKPAKELYIHRYGICDSDCIDADLFMLL